MGDSYSDDRGITRIMAAVSPEAKKRERLRKREYSRKYQQNLREKNPKRKRQLWHEHYERLKASAFTKLGGKCVKCGIDDVRVLQIDHINGGGTRESKLRGNLFAYRRVINGDSDLQLLCANCNWIKRHERKEYAQLRIDGY